MRARILVADDHKEMRNKVVRLLEPEFEMLEPVADGRTFLDVAATLKPDICILDISMPIINGIDAATRLKKSGSSAKVIFLTIHEDPDFLEAALQTGASGYVVKPRMVPDLRDALKAVIAGLTFVSPTLNCDAKPGRNQDTLP